MKITKLVLANVIALALGTTALAETMADQNISETAKVETDKGFYVGLSAGNNSMSLNYSADFTVAGSVGSYASEGHKTSSAMSPTVSLGYGISRKSQDGRQINLRAQTDLGKATASVSETLEHEVTILYMGYPNTQNLVTNLSMETEIFGSQSFHIGYTQENWNGWSAYTTVGGSYGRYNVEMSNSMDMEIRQHGDMFIGEIGLGIEKETKSGIVYFGEYKYGKSLSDLDVGTNDEYFTTQTNASIEYDRIQFGLRYKF